MLRALASFCYRRRRWVIAAWVATVIGLSVLAGAVGDDYREGFRIEGT